jgi:hypothetical protein
MSRNGAWFVILLVGVSVVILLGATATAVREFNDPGRWDEAILGPSDERQHIEMVAHGFAVDLPGDWETNMTPTQDPAQIERTGLRPVLAADPPDSRSECTVYIATGDEPTSEGCSPQEADESWGPEAWDAAYLVIGPLTSEYECSPGMGIGTLRLDGPVSMAFREPSGSVFVGYHFDDGRDDYVLACSVTPWLPDGSRSEVPWPSDPFDTNWSIQPIAETFEFLPAEE